MMNLIKKTKKKSMDKKVQGNEDLYNISWNYKISITLYF
jgi:hypothetical protein